MLQKGFTLIELMIVVAIIGILSMFALPAYQDYTKRTYVSEGIALSTAAKMATTEQFATQGTWPANNNDAGLPAPNVIVGQAVLGIGVQTGTPAANTGTGAAAGAASNIVIYYSERVVGNAQGATTAAPTVNTGTPNTALAANGTLHLAPTARSIANAAGSVEWVCLSRGANLEAKWLPANCRNRVS